MAEQTPYNRAAWRVVRLQVLSAAGNRCSIRSAVCTGRATDVDHIKPWRDGGSWFAVSNLRASCSQCNSSRSSHQKHHSGWERASTRIVLVTGFDPALGRPEVGLKANDAVFDLVELEGVLGSAAVARSVFDFLLKDLRRGEVSASKVWLFVPSVAGCVGLPHHRLMHFGVGVVEVAASGETAVEPGRY
jgi:hypothetical protein